VGGRPSPRGSPQSSFSRGEKTGKKASLPGSLQAEGRSCAISISTTQLMMGGLYKRRGGEIERGTLARTFDAARNQLTPGHEREKGSHLFREEKGNIGRGRVPQHLQKGFAAEGREAGQPGPLQSIHLFGKKKITLRKESKRIHGHGTRP